MGRGVLPVASPGSFVLHSRSDALAEPMCRASWPAIESSPRRELRHPLRSLPLVAVTSPSGADIARALRGMATMHSMAGENKEAARGTSRR
jgi:hypothetical protein